MGGYNNQLNVGGVGGGGVGEETRLARMCGEDVLQLFGAAYGVTEKN